MYGVAESLWINVAKMHFGGPAARWLQSIESQLSSCSWSSFCRKLHNRLDRDQYEALIGQLFHVKQTSTIVAYVSEITELVDQLSAYLSVLIICTSLCILLMAFVLVSSQIVNCALFMPPTDLDTACMVALL